MKVICIKTFPHSWRLTPGKFYQVLENQYYQYVLDDKGQVFAYNVKTFEYFITLEEFRQNQLDKLGI
jgi:hypothetical protein